MRHDIDDGQVVRLRAYRLTLRKPRLQARRGELVLRLPSHFGRRAWRVPMDEVAVADLTSPRFAVVEDSEDWYPDGIAIPYLFTTSPYTQPTTLLLFSKPQRVPPLRLLQAWYGEVSLGYWSSRSAAGASVDGVLLRATDPAEAAARLVAAGAERVDDPQAWLRVHRRVAIDPAERAALVARESRSSWLRRASAAAFAVVFGTGWWLKGHEQASWWLWAVVPAAVVSGLALHALARHAERG